MADTSVSNINDDTSSQADTDTTSDGLSSETNPTCIGPSLPHTQALMSGDTSTTYSMGNTPSNDSMDVASSTNSNAIDVPENTPSTQIPVPSPSTQITPQSQTPLTDVHTLSVNSSTPASESLVTSTTIISSITHSLPQSVVTAPEGLGNKPATCSSVAPALNNPQANPTESSVPLHVGSTPLTAGPAALQSTTANSNNAHLLITPGTDPTPTKLAKVAPVTNVGGQVVSAILTPITSVKAVGTTGGGVTGTTVSPKPALPIKVAKTVGATPLVKKVSLPVTGGKGSLPSTTNITLADILPHMIAMNTSSPPGTGSNTPVSNTPKTQVGKTGQTSSMLVPTGAKSGQGGSLVTVATPKSVKTSSTSTPTSSGVQVPSNTPLSKNDLQLLAFLQSNLPHLSHIQESIKSIIQNNIILQSMKSSLLPSTTGTGSTLLSPVQSTTQAPSSVTPVTLSIGGTSVPSSTPSVTTPTTQLQRKPVLAQVIGSNSTLKNVSSVSPSLSSPAVVTPTKEQPQTSAASHGIKTTPPSSTRLLVSPGAVPIQSKSSTQKGGGSSVSTPPKANTTPIDSSPIPELSLHMAPPTNLTPLDDDFDDVEMKEEPLDVGQPVVPLELPSFLADHTYCIYNPTVPSLPRQLPEYVVTIPSERLSYAPEVPDSPRTLFKLLKVLPKKVSGSARLRSSTMKSFTPLGRIGK